MRLLLLGLCLLLLAPATASALTPDGKVVVVDIDTGINAAHQEFAPDQLVGFFDFSDESVPAPGQLWDPDTAPFDPNGHGTATASMIGSLGVSDEQTPSAFPGVKLAMAKVGDDNGSIAGSLPDAIHWAINTVHADAINMSIGVIAPIGPAQSVIAQDTFDAIHEARAAGILFTVSNGNGIGNTGVVPGDGASTPYGSSLDVLSVGAESLDGLLVAYNPEVAAVYSVRAPAKTGRDGYTDTAGTSFASPFVNGFATRLISEAVAAGKPVSVAQIEQLVKNVATDTDIPPSSEGYGVVDTTLLPSALAAIRGGAIPARDDLSSQYVEEIAAGDRKFSNGMDPTAEYDDPGATARVGAHGGGAPAAAATAEPAATPATTPTPTAPAAAPAPAAVAPSLTGLRFLAKAPRLRMLLGQRVTLSVTVSRAGKRVRARTRPFTGPGTFTLKLGKLRAGRYVARVRAASELGAGAAVKTLRFRVR